jgi:hypothetical protein
MPRSNWYGIGLFVVFTVAAAACNERTQISEPSIAPRLTLSASGITAIDISNGVDGGYAQTVSSNGVILGRIGSTRGWWQAPSSTFTFLDSGFVQGGNRNADAGGTQGKVLLSTNGGPPWVEQSVLPPPGVPAGQFIVQDINDNRMMVGRTLGTGGFAVKWDNPSSVGSPLQLPAVAYPVSMSVARAVNNLGQIVGYLYETVSKRSTRYEAVVWNNGTPSILPLPPGATSQLASNINDAGIVAGIVDSRYPARWTPRSDGGYDVVVANIDTSPSNLDVSIDACGRIAGGSNSGAWIWDGTSPPVMIPGLRGPGYFAYIRDLNESGLLVGNSHWTTKKGANITHATMWTGLSACTPSP